MNMKKLAALALMSTMIFSSTAFAAETSAQPSAQTAQTETAKKWSDYFVVAHACGAVDGRSETNSLEAFEQNYEKGQRVFEIDFTLTMDNYLVARHDFAENSYYVMEQSYNKKVPVMMHDKFMSTPINYKYTSMDADTVVSLLNKYPDAYIVTDSKSTDKAKIEKEFTLLKQAVEKTGNKEIFDRIVVQLYFPDMLGYIRNVGGFKNFMLTTYQIKNPDFNYIANFCKQNNIAAIVMPEEVLTVEKSKIIHNAGIKLYTHTVNRLSAVKTDISVFDIDGVYSDYITENDINYIK